jgi:hypothetical protein
MNAIAPAQVAFMKQVGMPLATEATITYTEILPLRRLGYFTLADFVPGLSLMKSPRSSRCIRVLRASGWS